MSSSLPDDINALKRLLAEQEALNRALLEKLNEREREIDHLQAQLDKLRRMNFGSRSEKVSRRIAQMEADLKALQKESDTLTGRVDDPAVQRPLRQTRTRKPFPELLPRDEKRLKDGRYQVNRGHAGISKYCTSTAFQFCQRTLNHIARWVAATRVIMRARFIKSGKVICAGKMDRWDNATILFVVI